MCLVVIFNFVIPKQKPVKAEGVLATGLYLFFVAMCEKIGIDLIVDNEGTINAFKGFWSDVNKGFNNMSESVKETFENASSAWNGIYPVVVSLTKEKFVEAGLTIADWFTENWSIYFGGSGGNTYSPSATIGTVTPLNEDGYVGFTPETAFSFSYPDDSSIEYVVYQFNKCDLIIYNKCSAADLVESPYLENIASYEDICGSITRAENGLCHYYFMNKGNPQSCLGREFTLISSSGRDYYSWFRSNFPPIFYHFSTIDDSIYHAFYYQDGITYYIHEPDSDDSKYYLISTDGVRYDNNEYDSIDEFVNWYRELCGFVTSSITDSDIPYNPDQEQEEDRPGVIYGPDVDSQVRDYINSIPDDSVVDLTVAGTIDQAASIDDISSITYPGQLDLPSVNSDMWYDRFPFCIPFDIARLFSQFADDSEAPSFHFVILPADSFGLGNDEIGCDIDFADYNVFVQIMRIFLAAGFALWLLGITRKVIGS